MKITLVAAISVDGFIGKNDSDLSTKWTSKEDGQFFRKLSKDIKHLVVGAKTFATFNKKIDGRKFYVFSRQSEINNQYQNDMEIVNQDLEVFIESLENNGIKELMIAGGSSIYTQFINSGLVDEIYLTIEPILFGEGVKLFNDEVGVKLNLLEVIDLSSQTKVMHYRVEKK